MGDIFFKQIYKCQGKRIINLPFSLNLSIISRKYKSFTTIFYRFCSMDSFFSLSARTHIAILYLTEKFLATFFFRVLSLRKSECTQKFRCFSTMKAVASFYLAGNASDVPPFPFICSTCPQSLTALKGKRNER